LYLRRVVVSSSLFSAIRLEIPNSIGNGEATIVLGPNGSGKTVLAKAIRAALSKDEERWRADLADMGVQRVEIDFALQQWLGCLVYELPEGRREIRWEKLDHVSPAWSHGQRTSGQAVSRTEGGFDPPEFVPSELLPLVHIACAGQLDVYPDDNLLSSVVQAVCAPLERELAGWQAREAHLCGGEAGGRLAAVREELAQAEANLSRIEEIHRRLENARARRAQGEQRAAQLRAQSDMLTQEMVVQEKLVSLAERATLVEGWIAEIAAESAEVQRLRRLHVDLQTELDALEERFRGITDEVLLLAGDYLNLGTAEQDLIRQIQEIEDRRTDASAKLRQLHENLETLSESPPAFQNRIQQLRDEQDSINSELDSRHRARIELLRRREGLAERLQKEFASFVVCDEETLTALTAGQSRESAPQNPDEVALRERQKHLQEVQTTLAERFAGFDRVLATPESVREFHELQRSAALLSADLESLHRRLFVVERKIHPLRTAGVAVLAAAAAFALSAAFLSWDIAVFIAVCASGIALLAMRWATRRDEAVLCTSRAAAAALEKKLQDVHMAVEKMTRSLGPLAARDASIAIASLTEYRRLCDLRDMLSQEIHDEQALVIPDETAFMRLPQDLRALDRQLLAARIAEFNSVHREADRLNRAWQEYETGGAESQRISELEARLIELRQNLEALYTERSQQDAVREAERSRIEQEIADGEAAEANAEDLSRLHEELKRLQNKRAELARIIGGDVTEERLAELQNGERLRGELQTRLRDVRDQLSHCRNSEDLAAREAILIEEAAAVKQKVQTLDPLYLLVGSAADYSAKYAAQLRTQRQEIEQTLSSLGEVQRELLEVSADPLESAIVQERSLDDLQQIVSDGRRKVEDVERDLMTTRELIASIQAELSEAGPTVRADLQVEIGRRIQALSEQRFVALTIKEGRWMVEHADGAVRPLTSLSDGTRDLIFLAVRIGILECVKKVDAGPVVWDEVLSRQDERNLEFIRETVLRMAASRQVILLSRQSQLEAWGQMIVLGSEYSPENVHDHV
jgi:DNA repair exonuclease SbcCD ATPase subunit